MSGLTPRQYEALIFINERIRETGVPPSYDAIRLALGLNSKAGVSRILFCLEERGYILRLEKRAHSVRVLKLPDNLSERQRPAIPNRRFPPIKIPAPVMMASSRKAVLVPLMGRID